LLISDALGEGYGQESFACGGGLQNNKKSPKFDGKGGSFKDSVF
jgi:hypothetical protein